MKLTRTVSNLQPTRNSSVIRSQETRTSEASSAPVDTLSQTKASDYSLYNLGDNGTRKASAAWLKSLPDDVHAKNLQVLRDFDLQAASHKRFEKEISANSRDAFRELTPEQKDKVMELTKSFSGEAPLSRLLQERRLTEKDSSGYSPLDRVHELVNPNFTLAGNSRKTAVKILDGLAKPVSQSEEKWRNLPNPDVNASEFVRQAGERFRPRLA